MLIEYVSCKLSKVRWLTKRSRENDMKKCDSLWLCGSYAQPHNHVSLWSSRVSQQNRDVLQLTNHCQIDVEGDVNQITMINDKTAAVCQSSGSVSLISTPTPTSLSVCQHWSALHDCCTDCVCLGGVGKIVTCGHDGYIRIIDLDHKSDMTNIKVTSHNTLSCLDLVSSSQVILGTSSGHIKLFDIRQKHLALNLTNTPSIITCVKRNPNCAHIVSYGNDGGLLGLWDLRNTARQLLQVSSHKAYITELAYFKYENNNLISSSFDGQLLKWNISASSQLNSVESVLARDNKSAINSFDVNSHNEIIFSSDNEVLYYASL